MTFAIYEWKSFIDQCPKNWVILDKSLISDSNKVPYKGRLFCPGLPNGVKILFNEGQFQVEPLHSSCSMVAITGMYGKFLEELKLLMRILHKTCDYAALFANDVKGSNNSRQLIACGFKPIGELYTNLRTDHKVQWYQYIFGAD